MVHAKQAILETVECSVKRKRTPVIEAAIELKISKDELMGQPVISQLDFPGSLLSRNSACFPRAIEGNAIL